MIKGLISLFSSGAILNPMVLLGIVLGFVSAFKLSLEKIKFIATNHLSYVGLITVAWVYVWGFKKIYKDESWKLDYGAMALKTIAESARFLLAYFLSISFVILVGF